MAKNRKPWDVSEDQIPTMKQVWQEMHFDEVLAIADQAEAETHPVDCDPEGETWWKYRTDYYWNGEKIFDEYWHIRPDSTMERNALFRSLHDGQLGLDMAERLWEREKILSDKYKVKEGVGAPKKEE